MPYRIYGILFGLIGVFVVVALFAAGKSIKTQTKIGSRWKRNLVAAGLSFLSALGFSSLFAAGCKETSGESSNRAEKNEKLQQFEEEKSGGAEGTGKTTGSIEETDETEAAGGSEETDETEAVGASDVSTVISANQETEEIVSDSAGEGSAAPDEKELSANSESPGSDVEETEMQPEEESEPEPEVVLAKLRMSQRWDIVRKGFRAVASLAENSPKSTQAQRAEAKAGLDKAREALAFMVKRRELIRAEADILLAEFARVERAMYREPPSDYRGMCYRRAAFNPERDALNRLEKRLPILTRLVASGKVKRGVRDKVLESMERDIETLAAAASDLKGRSESTFRNMADGKTYEGLLGPEDRKKAKRILPRMKRLIRRLKRMSARR